MGIASSLATALANCQPAKIYPACQENLARINNKKTDKQETAQKIYMKNAKTQDDLINTTIGML